MSTRALRKLQHNNDLVDLRLAKGSDAPVPDGSSDIADVEDDDLSQSTTVKTKSSKKSAPQNLFALLSEEAEGEKGTEDSEEANEESEKEVVVMAKTKKKKKKNKRKAKENKTEIQNQQEDEIEATVRQIDELMCGKQNQLRIQNSARSPDDLGRVMKSVLSIEHRNLNPENEIKRIFGSKVVEQERIQRRQRGHPPRRMWLVQPRPEWGPVTKIGLSMRLVETKNGLQYFTFEHGKSFQKIQFEFLDAVESMNPQNITNILKLYPFHIDTLMQLSEIYRMSEDAQGASEMIERVLYVFESCFHPMFSLTQGTSRLDYRRNENRSFYLAIFHHLASVGRRGCWRTALEFCKLLLSFDPDNDPLCVLLMIDFYALRSEQYAFLVHLFEEWESHRNLSLLPNFAFSVSLALYHMSTNGECSEERADEMLQKSLIMFPGLLFPLLDKCSVAPDSLVQKHDFFMAKAQTSQPAELEQLIRLYVGRSHYCWKEPEVMLWLERNVRRVLERVDSKDPLIEQCATKRLNMYRGTPRNICRHIIVSDIKEAMSALPPEVRLTPILSHDPLPPLDAISSYERPPRPTRAQQSGGPLSTFLRSLWPSFDPSEPAPELAEGAVGGQWTNTRLPDGVRALTHALSELLADIRFMPHPVENGAQADRPEDPAENQNEPDDQDEDNDWD